MTIVQEQVVVDDSGSNTPFTMTFGTAPTDGNLLVAVIFLYKAGASVASSSGWSNPVEWGQDDRLEMFHKTASSEGTGHTWTSSDNGLYGWMAEYSGLDFASGAIDGSSVDRGVSAAADSGNVTPSTSDSFAVGGVGTGGGGTTATQPSGWSEEDTLGGIGNTSCYVATKEISGTGAFAYDPSLSGSDGWVAGLMVFVSDVAVFTPLITVY